MNTKHTHQIRTATPATLGKAASPRSQSGGRRLHGRDTREGS